MGSVLPRMSFARHYLHYKPYWHSNEGHRQGLECQGSDTPSNIFPRFLFFFYARLFCASVGHRDVKVNIPRVDVGKGNPGYIAFTELLFSPHPVSENTNCSRSIGVIIPSLEPLRFSCRGHFCWHYLHGTKMFPKFIETVATRRRSKVTRLFTGSPLLQYCTFARTFNITAYCI